MDSQLRTIDLSQAGPGQFRRTRSKFVELIWMICESLLVRNPLQISSKVRVAVLRLFGAKIGKKVIVRDVHVKFPWNLEVGDNCWLGERVWIHNQDWVFIGRDVVISQGTFITTGSHDLYQTMNLITKPVRINDGAWVTSRCIVTMGVEIGGNAVVTPGTVVYKSLEAGGIYGESPIRLLRYRWSAEDPQPPLEEQAPSRTLVEQSAKDF